MKHVCYEGQEAYPTGTFTKSILSLTYMDVYTCSSMHLHADIATSHDRAEGVAFRISDNSA